MLNKEKLLLLAAIYSLLPGAAQGAFAESSESEQTKNKRSTSLEKVQPGAAARTKTGSQPAQ
jgi:hypothetical protein